MQRRTIAFVPLHDGATTIAVPGSHRGSGRNRLDVPAWLEQLERSHFAIAVAVTLLTSVGTVAGRPPRLFELTLLVGAVTLLGLPHGALDYLAGRSVMRPVFGRLWLLPFGALYLSLAALVILCWELAPRATLVSFLVVAAGHFGIGDVRPEVALGAESRFSTFGLAIEAVARGSLMIAAILHFHPETASELFASLLPSSAEELAASLRATSPRLAVVEGALIAVILAHHLGGWALGVTEHGRAALEIVILAMLFCLTPPLISFVIYFCLWHSFRHSLGLAAMLDRRSARAGFVALARHAWPTTVVAASIAAAAYLFLGKQAPGEALVAVVFVGLSALTLPHIVFTHLAEQRA